MTALLFEGTTLQLGIPGGPELLIIVAIAVLLFGASKLPKLARSMGSATGEFKKGRQQVEEELQEIRDGSVASDEDAAGAEKDVVTAEEDVATADEDVAPSEAERSNA